MATNLVATPTSSAPFLPLPPITTGYASSTTPTVITAQPAIKLAQAQSNNVNQLSSTVAANNAAKAAKSIATPAVAAPIAPKAPVLGPVAGNGPVATPSQFANDALTSQANVSGMTPQQMSALAEKQSSLNPNYVPPPILGPVAGNGATTQTTPQQSVAVGPGNVTPAETKTSSWGRTGTYQDPATGANVYQEQTWNPGTGQFDTVTYDASTGARAGRSAVTGAATNVSTAQGGVSALPTDPTTGLPYQSQIDSLTKQTDDLHAKYMTDLEKLRNGTIPLTESQQGQLDAMKMQFDKLKQQQIVANQNFTQGTTIAGIASGRNMYAPEVELGNIKKTVDQGIEAIATIDAQALSTMYAAKTAMQAENWKGLDKAYTELDKYLQEKQTRLDALQKFTVERTDKLTEQNRQAEKDKLDYSTTIAPGIASNLTYVKKDGTLYEPTEAEIQTSATASKIDPAVLRASIYEQASKLRAEQTKKAETEAAQFTKDKNAIIKAAAESSAPASVIAKINAAKSYAEAVDAGGDYLGSASGIVGEYNFYKRDEEAAGRAPVSFAEYQDADANRKVLAATIADSSGLTPSQNSNFVRISTKYQDDAVIKAGQSAAQSKAIADQIIADPGKATNQLIALYTLVKNLDPNSAVKEGETALVGQTQSFFGKWGNKLEGLVSGQILSDSATKEAATAIKSLATSWEDAAARRENSYKSQANVANVGSAFDAYLNGTKSMPTTADSIRSSQQQFDDYYKSNPDKRQQMDALSSDPAGYTDEQIMEIIGVPVRFNSVGGDTNTATIPVSGKKPIPVASATQAIKTSKDQNSWGGQCGQFVHSLVADYPYGLNGINQKEAVMNVPKTETPRVGDVVIQRIGGQYGHVAVVNAIDPKTGKITLTESNYYDKTKPEKVTHDRTINVDDNTISGYFRGELNQGLLA